MASMKQVRLVGSAQTMRSACLECWRVIFRFIGSDIELVDYLDDH